MFYGTYEIYQPDITGNFIHIIGDVYHVEDTFSVSKVYYIFPDDKFIKSRSEPNASFFIEKKYLINKINKLNSKYLMYFV